MDPPSRDEYAILNELYGFKCTPQELDVLTEISQDSFKSIQFVDEAPGLTPDLKYVARDVHIPNKEDNKHNGWYYKCSLKGADCGPLLGKKFAIKDNTCVAGVPMMNGSKLLLGFTPTQHSSVVKRILDAGGEIIGKSVTVDMCLSGASFPTGTGPVTNPNNPLHSAGGSSAGSAALVATGEVDMATGGDQGGSVRIPASNCGIVGLKPTYGLVPYTGAIPIETTIDHIGPMTKNVKDCAQFLQVIAGHDGGTDSRQGPFPFPVPDYVAAVENAHGSKFKIAILKEAFDISSAEVQEVCRQAVGILTTCGDFPMVADVSLPKHSDAHHIWSAVAMPGLSAQMVDGEGFGVGAHGLLNPEISAAMRAGFKGRPHELSIVAKLCTLGGKYTLKKYGYSNYAKAQCLTVDLRREYDRILNQYDVIIMPTLPVSPTEIPAADASPAEIIGKCLNMITNTCPFDITHHPAITINAGFTKNGLPIGLQFVGKHFQDDKLLAVASLAEKALMSNQKKA